MNFLSLVFAIPLIAVAGGIALSIMKEKYRVQEISMHTTGNDIQRMLEENISTNKQLLAKLDSLEARVVGMEKMLNEIPS